MDPDYSAGAGGDSRSTSITSISSPRSIAFAADATHDVLGDVVLQLALSADHAPCHAGNGLAQQTRVF